MKKVLFKKWIPIVFEGEPKRKKEGTGQWEDQYTHAGVFHQWGTSYEEFENNAGNYTVAIVELPDGTINEVLPTNIKFI